MPLSFVQVGDLEPDFKSDRVRKGGYPEIVTRYWFDACRHLFGRFRRDAGPDFPRPDVILFTGDLYSGPKIAMKWKDEYERLFDVWSDLVEGGATIIWTIASHESGAFPKKWPFGGDSHLPVGHKRLILAAKPGGEIICMASGWRILAFGNLGGSKKREAYKRGVKRWEKKIEGNRVIAVSAADRCFDMKEWGSHVALGGLQGHTKHAEETRKPRSNDKVHLLGRPYDWMSKAGVFERLDFVWGVACDDGTVRAVRVLAPEPPGVPTRRASWLKWDVREIPAAT